MGGRIIEKEKGKYIVDRNVVNFSAIQYDVAECLTIGVDPPC
jgi:hypothetical protein